MQPSDTLVTLGDYVDRGPDSAEVIETLVGQVGNCNLVPLMGNHEILMLDGMHDHQKYRFWQSCGGDATVASYGDIQKIPQHHRIFFQNLRPFHETDRHIFVHASYVHDLQMDQQSDRVMYWEHLTDEVPPEHMSGKKVFVGHTPQIDGEVYDLGHLLLLDTFCFGGKWLTAIDADSGQLWQADNHGQLRETPE